MEGVLKSIFQNSTISVKEDTYAAVYAITDPGEPSIVCILGTVPIVVFMTVKLFIKRSPHLDIS